VCIDYVTIQKGPGFVYAFGNNIYRRVKTEGNVKYPKCSQTGCDGSAKLVGAVMFVGVSTLAL
jgi:hypothetical protein